MCWRLVKVITGTASAKRSTLWAGTKHCDHGGLFLQNIHHPPDCIHCIAAMQMCRRSRFLPVSVLYWLLLENLFALPRRGEGASPPFWLLLSAPALSQHSVSSSQSPCQQDFTQWPGELQSVAQPHTLPLSPSLSHTHTHRTSTHTQTNTLQLSSPPPPHSPARLVNRHLLDIMCEKSPKACRANAERIATERLLINDQQPQSQV